MSSKSAPKKGGFSSHAAAAPPRKSSSAPAKPSSAAPKRFVSRAAVSPSSAVVPRPSLRTYVPPVNKSITRWDPVVSVEHKKKKKKSSKTHKAISFLKGAAKVAAQVAPAVLPLLLAGHAPTNLAAKAAGVPGVPDLSSAATVGVSNAVSVAKYATGTFVPTYKQQSGRVIGVTWPGCEEIATVGSPPTGTSWRAGDVMLKVSLNPLSPDWVGTALTTQARLWQNYKLVRISVMFQPAVATTTAGQMIGFCINDPDEDWTLTGDAAIKSALAHQFSDIFNTWSVGCWGMAIDKSLSSKYTQGDGSDPRLTSPGDLYLLCSADIDMTSIDSLGTIVVAYEYEFEVKADLEEGFMPGSGVNMEWANALTLANQGASSYVPYGLVISQPTTETGPLAPTVGCQQVRDANGVTGAGFSVPPGTYFVQLNVTGAGSGTNATMSSGINVSWFADTSSGSGVYADIGRRVIVSPTGANVVPDGTCTGALGAVGYSRIQLLQNGSFTITFSFIINSDIATDFFVWMSFASQTGTWTTTGGANIFSLSSNLFIPPNVSPMQAIRDKIDMQARETAEMEKKLDSLSKLLVSLLPSSPPVGPVPHPELWTQLLSSYGALTPEDRADAVASLQTAAKYTYTSGP